MTKHVSKAACRLQFVLILSLAAGGCSTLPESVQEFGRKVGAAGAQFGSYVGTTFSKLLNRDEQEKMGSATVGAAESGKDKNWRNQESGTSGSARVVATDKETRQIEVKVLKKQVKTVPPLDFIDETYTAMKITNVRGGPGTDYVKVSALSAGTKVTVVGKVREQPWFLISQDGVGRGFVYHTLLTRTPDLTADKADSAVADEDVAQQTVSSERVCRSIEQTVVLADGTKQSETVRACKGPDGWKLAPKS